MMVCYVAIPSRLIGVKPTTSRRDKLTASGGGGALGAMVCTPPYVLGRVGILMLGSPALLIPGIILLACGTTLQAGATGAVETVKMSAKLLAPGPQTPHDAAGSRPPIGKDRGRSTRARAGRSLPPVGHLTNLTLAARATIH